MLSFCVTQPDLVPKSKSSALAFRCDIGHTDDVAGESRRAARERITRALMDAARRQLGEVGAAGLSLREVAREIGMVSSAVYRYVESRDELLTRLIVEAYDALGTTAETASRRAHDDAPGDDLARWLATARSVRQWAIDHPHEYLLLYGSPVPGYAAPDDTVDPGTRVSRALLAIVADARTAGRLAEPAEPDLGDGHLATELRHLAAEIRVELAPATMVAAIAAWTQMFGLVSFELANQTRGVVADHAALFDATVVRLAHHIGLRDGTMAR